MTFKGICMNFSLELKKNILSHPVTSKQPHKIVQILMRHPVGGNLRAIIFMDKRCIFALCSKFQRANCVGAIIFVLEKVLHLGKPK